MGRGVSATCVTALALAAVLAGCGGGDQSNRSTSTAAARSTAGSPTAPAASSTTAPTSPSATSTTAPTPPSAAAYWPYSKLVASLAGRTIVLSNTTVRLDPALLECNGDGAPRQVGPTPGWSHYTCTQTLFQDGTDHDITFDVAILSPTQLRIISPRNGAQ